MNQDDNQIVPCSECGAKNRLPLDRLKKSRLSGETVKCGRCHQPLDLSSSRQDSATVYKMRCLNCGAKNRIPGDHVDDGAKCGKCGESLPVGELFAPQPIMVTDNNFEDKMLNSPLPALMFAWASW